MKENTSTTPLFFGFLFALICYLIWIMAKQMIGPIIFGLILAGVFFPIKEKFVNKKRLSDTSASALTCTLIFVVVLLPLLFISLSVSKEALNLYQTIRSGLDQQEVNNFLFGDGFLATGIKSLSSTLNLDIDIYTLKSKLFEILKGASVSFLRGINSLVGDVVMFLFDVIIMMIVTFGVLVEGAKLKNYIFELSPLPDEQEQKILEKFNQMNYVTLVCNGLGGLIQGVLAGIALWICGINSVLLWTVVMILLAFIPLVGISLVTIPASLYLILTGATAMGIFLFFFTTIVSLVVENWFKPKFIGNRISINSTFVLLSIIGGMGVFGMGGIFYGPIISILFLTIVEIYHDSYNKTS